MKEYYFKEQLAMFEKYEDVIRKSTDYRIQDALKGLDRHLNEYRKNNPRVGATDMGENVHDIGHLTPTPVSFAKPLKGRDTPDFPS